MWLALSSIVLASAIGFNILALWLSGCFERKQPESQNPNTATGLLLGPTLRRLWFSTASLLASSMRWLENAGLVPTAATLICHQSSLSAGRSNGQDFLHRTPALAACGEVNTLALIQGTRPILLVRQKDGSIGSPDTA